MLRYQFWGFGLFVFALYAKNLVQGGGGQGRHAVARAVGRRGSGRWRARSRDRAEVKDRVAADPAAAVLDVPAGRPATVVFGALVSTLGFALLLFCGFFSFFLGKISSDTITQQAMPDDFRGRAFALYDIAYNLGFIVPAIILSVDLGRGQRVAHARDPDRVGRGVPRADGPGRRVGQEACATSSRRRTTWSKVTSWSPGCRRLSAPAAPSTRGIWRPAELGLLALRVVAARRRWSSASRTDPDSAAQRFFEIAHAPGHAVARHARWSTRSATRIVIRAVGWGSLALARVLLALVAFGADLVAWRAVARGWGRDAAIRYLWLGAPLLIFIYRRSDLVPVALAALGLAWARRDRERAGGIALGVAALGKLWPVVVAPALAMEREDARAADRRDRAAAGIVVWIAIGGRDALRQVGTFRGSTGWEIGSTIGVPVWAFTGQHRFEEGANRAGTIPPGAPEALLARRS